MLRRLVVAPRRRASLTVLLWVTLPLWLIGAAALSPLLPGRLAGAAAAVGLHPLPDLRGVLLVVMLGLWIASGFGWRIRTPYFEGIHYDLVQGVMWVFFREARRVLRLTHRDRRPGAGRAPRDARSWSAAGTPGRATRSR